MPLRASLSLLSALKWGWVIQGRFLPAEILYSSVFSEADCKIVGVFLLFFFFWQLSCVSHDVSSGDNMTFLMPWFWKLYK